MQSQHNLHEDFALCQEATVIHFT